MRLGKRKPTGLAALQAAYNDADRRGDLEAVLAALGEITSTFPDVSWGWYDLGLRHKWLRNWELSRDCNLRALELVESRGETEGEVAEAWNLGIAATALGDWPTARRAWRAFGIDIEGEEQAPIRMNFGTAPIRLNPDPRFSEEELLVDGVRYDTEVVWARRLCPTRAEIESVPFPESGHRFGDVVLHDGDPVGERRYGDQVRGVFNEIALLERSPWATLRTEVPAVDDGALAELSDLFHERGYAAECWTRNTQILCKACSEGTVGAQHDHEVGEEPARRETSLVIGLGAPRDEAERLLDIWATAASGRDRGAVDEA
jgi:hypothetical protein